VFVHDYLQFFKKSLHYFFKKRRKLISLTLGKILDLAELVATNSHLFSLLCFQIIPLVFVSRIA